MKQILLQHLLLQPRAAFLTKRTRLTSGARFTSRLTFCALLLFGWAFTSFAQSPCDEDDDVMHYLIVKWKISTEQTMFCVGTYTIQVTATNVDFRLAIKPGDSPTYPFYASIQGSYVSKREDNGVPACEGSNSRPPDKWEDENIVINHPIVPNADVPIYAYDDSTPSDDYIYGAWGYGVNVIRSKSLEALNAFVKKPHVEEYPLDYYGYPFSVTRYPTVLSYFNSTMIESLVDPDAIVLLALSESSVPDCICKETITTTCKQAITCVDGTFHCFETYPCTRNVCEEDEKDPCELEPTIKVRQP